MQILFGVLLVAAFQPVFTGLGNLDRAFYVAAVTLGAAGAGALRGSSVVAACAGGWDAGCGGV
ncbi:hypothetical protein GCM10010300_34200 [Streptomyces olivaceoviridis]|uniref:DUF6328 family protein n=1 Tax=Streptomyces olivaceoviridis TaxID=1921 RepID=UPI001671BDDD|nr:DUF6328 family protein [Streptomyces olivaceoviridis]GGY87026.1 hypothetical protein GCM10010300_34200 [Streptomyces olivaceoviridis]